MKGKGPSAPVQRSADEEFGAMMKYIPQMYDAEAQAQLKYMPQMARAQTDAQIENMPRIGEATRTETSKMRQADVLDLEQLGPSARDAILNTNEQYQIMDRMAMKDLMLDGELSAQDKRESDQAARGAMSARGLVMSSPAAVQEVLSRDSMKRGRRNDARAFSMRMGAISDPRDIIFQGRSQVPAMAMQTAGGSRLSGQLASQVPGAVQDIYGYNANAVNSHKIHKSNVSMANAAQGNQLIGAGIAAVGSIAGGAMAM